MTDLEIQQELEELYTILTTDHPERQETEFTFTIILGLLNRDITKSGYLQAVEEIKPFFFSQIPDMEEVEEQIWFLKLVVQDNRFWSLLKRIFYYGLLHDGATGTIISQYYHLKDEQLIVMIAENMETNRHQPNLDSATDQLLKKIVKRKAVLIQQPGMIAKLKKLAMQEEMRQEYMRDVYSRLTGTSDADMKKALLEMNKYLIKHNENHRNYLKTKEGIQELQNTYSRIIDPRFKREMKHFLLREEKQGLIVMEEAFQFNQTILLEKIRQEIFITGRLKRKNYQFGKNMTELLEDISVIGPFSIHVLYQQAHEQILQMINNLFSYLSLVVTNDTSMENKLESMLEKVFKPYKNHVAETIQSKFEPLNEEIMNLLSAVEKVGKQYDNARKQDVARGLLSFSVFGLARNIKRIFKEEKQFDTNMEKASKQLIHLYDTFFTYLPKIEESLYNHYVKLVEEIYKQVFHPLMVNMIRKFEPVRKIGGIHEYEANAIQFSDEFKKKVVDGFTIYIAKTFQSYLR